LLTVLVDLQARVDVAREAWSELILDPEMVLADPDDDPAAFATVSTAARLMPVPVARLRAAAESAPTTLLRVLDEQVGRVAENTARVQAVERLMSLAAEHHWTHPTPGELGRSLFVVGSEGLWDLPTFEPVRVGELSPTRVRLLVGEETTS
jgi:hypothetical protein